ncbi:hypothetical protein O6H91_01G057400 [Diphasiastrum complanatum]|uniref:Uncharacterized protein n=5 Tax=Diphasiastrum complanatum TaxID=34168 RepID=A0ACC2ERA5_DIPCM|nr:hypothetical protein O6H91_01G057400 [Diphasiastrum complanatum]KAJ7569014.1 hypothetical protein O6H91_01G057400 [Diphasiastrum complanatum]KAJ7569016.1 hypothetical protein O6H91_01G057400 [Diphasiastrum complanatum]KAJ7569017.1 hypothetical protein O6H91_01G057400 [Diphasiastrum complanatum]KAJ7569018.1 hypothetical protein O6H91_01G057400 [Diphasiastrum complanatum]
MVGGGSRKDNGLPAISSTNIFAALESRRRKSSKKRLEKSSSKGAEVNKGNGNQGEQAEEPAPFWAPSPVTVTSWADVEDDDDYYATTAPPPWASEKPAEILEAHKDGLSQGEESEGDEDAEDEGEDDLEEDAEVEAADTVSVEQLSLIPTAPSTPVVREPERQLSKRELKKKELAELDAVLAELGLSKKPEDGNDPSPVEEKKLEVNTDENGEIELKGNSHLLTESKSSKRRKAKREKSFKEVKDGDVPTSVEVETETKDEENGVDTGEAASVPADPKEVLKKLASLKKKRSMKDSDAAAKAAAAEASARAAKLAAAKKKEKNHYNQQPVR